MGNADILFLRDSEISHAFASNYFAYRGASYQTVSEWNGKIGGVDLANFDVISLGDRSTIENHSYYTANTYASFNINVGQMAYGAAAAYSSRQGRILIGADYLLVGYNYSGFGNYNDLNSYQASSLQNAATINGQTISLGSASAIDIFGKLTRFSINNDTLIVSNISLSKVVRLGEGSSILANSTGGTSGYLDDGTCAVGGCVSYGISSGIAGRAGSINIHAINLSMDAGSSINSSNNTFNGGESIVIQGDGTGTVSMKSGAAIKSDTLGANGPFQLFSAGKIILERMDSVNIDGGSITTQSDGSGNAGTVAIGADKLTISNGGLISSKASADSSNGNAGQILFGGKHSEFDESGSYVLTAADRLILSGGSVISTSTERVGGSGNAGSITLSTAQLDVGLDPGGTGNAITSTTSGSGDAGTVTINKAGAALDRLGMVGGRISTSTSGSGSARDIGLQVTALTMDASEISSSTSGSGRAGNVTLTGGSGAAMTSAVLSNNSTISTSATGGAGASAGNILLDAQSLVLAGASAVTSTTNTAGNAGTVTVQNSTAGGGGSVLVRGGSSISTSSTGVGAAGTVEIGQDGHVSTVTVDGGTVSSVADTGSSGKAGNVNLQATDAIVVRNGGSVSTSNRASAPSGGTSGNIVLKTAALTVGQSDDTVGGASITATTSNSVGAGSVSLTGVSGGTSSADSLTMVGGTVSTSTSGTGNAGDVTLLASQVSLDNGSKVTSETTRVAGGSGRAGSVTLRNTGALAGSRVQIQGGSQVSSSTSGSGNAGAVLVSGYQTALISGAGSGLLSASCDLTADANCQTGSSATRGNAGTVTLDADVVTVGSGARVASNSNASGNAGTVTVQNSRGTAGTVTVSGGGSISSASTGTGRAGSVSIGADGHVANVLLSAGSIVSEGGADSAGAGQVSVLATDTVTLNQGAYIATDNGSRQSSASKGLITLTAGQLEMDNASISSSTSGAAQAGDVNVVVARTVNINNKSVISTSAQTGSTGDAGAITIQAAAMNLNNSRRYDSQIYSVLKIRDTQQGNFGILTTTDGAGKAGAINVTVSGQVCLIESSISAAALGNSTGRAGAVTVKAQSLKMDPSYISSSDQGSKNTVDGGAGSVSVALTGGSFTLTGDAARTAGSGILTSSVDNNAGSVAVTGVTDMLLRDGLIQTSVTGTGGGRGGDIFVEAKNLSLDTGFIQANTVATGQPGGVVTVQNETLTATQNNVFRSPKEGFGFEPNVAGFNVLQASSQTGNAGVVSIQSGLNTNLAAAAPLNGTYIDVDALARDYCSVGTVSSLTLGGRGGLPESFDGFILLGASQLGRDVSVRDAADGVK